VYARNELRNFNSNSIDPHETTLGALIEELDKNLKSEPEFEDDNDTSADLDEQDEFVMKEGLKRVRQIVARRRQSNVSRATPLTLDLFEKPKTSMLASKISDFFAKFFL
jgi:protein involved in sex pheromone biosynthesis